jgi:hypothetical protein
MKTMRNGLLAVGASACLLLTFACSRAPRTAAAGNPVSISDIENNPNTYTGKTVTVSGRVADVMGGRAMQLAPEGPGSGPTILVVGRQDWTSLEGGNGQQAAPSPNDVIQVTGTARMFDPKEMQRDAPGALSDAQMSDWQGKPVIIAKSIAPLSPASSSTSPTGQ